MRQGQNLDRQITAINQELDRIKKDNKDVYDAANMTLPANASKQMKEMQVTNQARIKELEKDARDEQKRIKEKINALDTGDKLKSNTDDPLSLRKK